MRNENCVNCLRLLLSALDISTEGGWEESLTISLVLIVSLEKL